VLAEELQHVERPPDRADRTVVRRHVNEYRVEYLNVPNSGTVPFGVLTDSALSFRRMKRGLMV
jgi:hypothetical protein